jgi:hypothetical protein
LVFPLIAGELEVGQMELHSDEFDILAVIKFLSWGLKDLLQQKEIAFNMDVDETVSQLLTSHFVLGDKQRIVQTLGEALPQPFSYFCISIFWVNPPSGQRYSLF